MFCLFSSTAHDARGTLVVIFVFLCVGIRARGFLRSWYRIVVFCVLVHVYSCVSVRVYDRPAPTTTTFSSVVLKLVFTPDVEPATQAWRLVLPYYRIPVVWDIRIHPFLAILVSIVWLLGFDSQSYTHVCHRSFFFSRKRRKREEDKSLWLQSCRAGQAAARIEYGWSCLMRRCRCPSAFTLCNVSWVLFHVCVFWSWSALALKKGVVSRFTLTGSTRCLWAGGQW